MIKNYPNTRPHLTIAALTLLCLGTLMSFEISQAQESPSDSTPEKLAVAGMDTWMKGIDQEDYEGSWKTASSSFKKALSSEYWVQACSSVRQPLGKVIDRKMVSAVYQKDLPEGGTILKGEFVIAQFETSYEKMKYTIETVTFTKDTDGIWRAAGYYIKPR